MATGTAAATQLRPGDQDLAAIERLKQARAAIKAELAKVIVGQEQVIDEILISVFTRSHALLVGVPGLAKTLMISSLAQTLHLSFKRIQFTPDLMPSDITGTEVIYQDQSTGERQFKFLKGPIFANIVLADGDGGDIAADDGVEPDAALAAHAHVADDGAVVGAVGAVGMLGEKGHVGNVTERSQNSEFRSQNEKALGVYSASRAVGSAHPTGLQCAWRFQQCR